MAEGLVLIFLRRDCWLGLLPTRDFGGLDLGPGILVDLDESEDY